MTIKTLYLLRGVSGAGKTTLAHTIAHKNCCISADDYFYFKGDGEYAFNKEELSKAHQYCKDKTKQCLSQNISDVVVVHNTFTTEKELTPYLNMAMLFNYRSVVLVIENRHGGKSVHDVPESTLIRQETNLKNSIKLR